MREEGASASYQKKDDQIENHEFPEQPISLDFSPQEKFRAKLYKLDTNQRWQDKGTGYFSIKHEGEGRYSMQLIEEQEHTEGSNHVNDLLNNELIESQFCFKRQRDTIITWQDKDRERDQAVSFQNCQGALYTWEKICFI